MAEQLAPATPHGVIQHPKSQVRRPVNLGLARFFLDRGDLLTLSGALQQVRPLKIRYTEKTGGRFLLLINGGTGEVASKKVANRSSDGTPGVRSKGLEKANLGAFQVELDKTAVLPQTSGLSIPE